MDLTKNGIRSVMSSVRVATYLCLALIGLVLTTSAACSDVTAPPSPSNVSAEASESSEQPSRPGETVETWDVLYMGGAKIGYVQTRTEPFEESGQPLVRIVSENKMSMKRFNQTVTQQVTMTCIESPAGELVRFKSEIQPGNMITKGVCASGNLRLETQTPGKTQTALIPFDRSWGGFFAQEQSLRRIPMQPGEHRTVRALLPVFNQTGDIELDAKERESVQLLDGERELLRVETSVEIAGAKIDQIIWTDDKGETLKSEIPTLGQVSYRTTEQIALGQDSAAEFDLGAATVVQVARRLANPHGTARVAYRVSLENAVPETVFPSGATQLVRSTGGNTAEIVVHALRPETAATSALAADSPPTTADLASNNLIQSDDARVVEFAASIAPDERDPWRLACALERSVRDNVRVKDFSQAFASAADVARTLEGDCTEHAVLLAALCRARKIPARVAIGLVYYDLAGGFAYHMWNEVWIDGHWIPLDGTLGRSGIGAAHLKVSHSDLEGVSPYAAFLPVFQVLGQMKLEILDVTGTATSSQSP